MTGAKVYGTFSNEGAPREQLRRENKNGQSDMRQERNASDGLLGHASHAVGVLGDLRVQS